MLKFYTETTGFSGKVSFLEENLRDCPVIITLDNKTKKTRMEVLRKLEASCRELIMRANTADDITAVKTARGAIVFKNPREYDDKYFLHLKRAKEIHDDWEKIYIKHIDFEKAGEIAKLVADKLIGKRRAPGKAENVNRFFGTLTGSQSVNFIDELTSGFSMRIFIKGRPGSGKSTLMKFVRNAANDAGFNTETYRCAFDPESVDMVIIRTLGVCIFDSTPPHEMFPSRKGDEILDLYDLTLPGGTDELYKSEIEKFSKSYNLEIASAKQFLKTVEDEDDELDEEIINSIANKLI